MWNGIAFLIWKYPDCDERSRIVKSILAGQGTVVMAQSCPKNAICVDYVIVPIEDADVPPNLNGAQLVTTCLLDGELLMYLH